METVVLDPDQKQALVDDVNEYLSPASPKWYAVRGIPYRRGYLFHGPPGKFWNLTLSCTLEELRTNLVIGTGKSSLSFALAGLFGLNVFVISLLEPTLTETDLAMLFNNLPKRCIVLLEDIDTAGLVRSDNDDEAEPRPSDGTKEDKITAADLVKELKKPGRRGGGMGGGTTIDGEVKMGISLSGLLNAIDGVASHEGRVLVMTTNHPEKLDPALIRPGRVDMQVAFTLATKHQIREIFSKMYYSNEQPLAGLLENGALTNGNQDLINGHTKVNGHMIHTNGSAEPLLMPNSTKRYYSQEEIKSLADDFADLVPEGKFSPAEVQNFLITRKKDPQRAMDEVEKWRDELLETKEKKTKVINAR
jgi:chaperone BCS1